MSYESTMTISRKRAEEWTIHKLVEKMGKVSSLPDSELEDLLYSLTRESNYFDNFRISDSEES